MLSGFLITLLLLAEMRSTGTVSLSGFYMRRILRIFPLYFLSLLIAPILQYIGLIRLSGCNYWYAFTYTINFAPKECVLTSYSHFWSLAVEEHFYLIWPLVFLLFRRWALAFTVLVILMCWIVSEDGYSLFAAFSDKYYVNRWTIPAAAPIAIGCVGAYFCNNKYLVRTFDKVGGIIVCVSLFTIVYPWANIFGIYLAALGVTIFIFLKQRSAVTRVLEWRPLAWIGTISYGLYVWQGVLGGNGTYREFPVFPPPLYEGLAWAFVASIASYYLFEKPIMRLKHRFSWHRGPQAMSVVTR